MKPEKELESWINTLKEIVIKAPAMVYIDKKKAQRLSEILFFLSSLKKRCFGDKDGEEHESRQM